MSQENRYVNLTGSGFVLTGSGVVSGMYVNSTSSGTVKLTDTAVADTGGTETVIFNTITPAIGYHNLGNVQVSRGCYASRAGTSLDVTFFTKKTD